MDPDGSVHARNDPALPPPTGGPADPTPGEIALHAARAGASRTAKTGPRARRAAARTLRGELKRLLARRAIDRATHDRHRRAFDDAIRTAARIGGTRGKELQAVVTNLHDIAARGSLTAPRLPVLFRTLERNREWWTTGRLLTYGQRVEFSDSELVWQYYPGEGIQLQVLGTFGKANGLWMARDDDKLRALLDEMVPLAADRGGALTWEYYFDFGGGAPPWTSGMSQATGIQSLARASQRLDEPSYLETARRALRLFQLDAPTGVRVPTKAGARYLIYSYAPGQQVLNAFAQTLVGLWDYSQIDRESRLAGRLFRAGDRQLRHDLPASDTGAWTLYQVGGAEADLNYHTLSRDFVHNLCDRARIDFYCDADERFSRYLREPPALELLTRRVRAKQKVLVRFELSKIARVGMTIRRGETTVLSTSATVPRGTRSYSWTVPATPGTYDVTLTGTDLAGNFERTTGTITVLGRPPRV